MATSHHQKMPPPGPVHQNTSLFGNNQQSHQTGAVYENRFSHPLGAPPPLRNLDLTKPPPTMQSPQAADYPPQADFVPLSRQINNSFPSKPNDTNVFKIPPPAAGLSPGNGLFTSSAINGSTFAASSSTSPAQVIMGAHSLGLSSTSTSR